jgi:GNAT superfamily N-acetyltransferase
VRIRDARFEDLEGITEVRTAVAENHLSIEQMAARGITRERIIHDLTARKLRGWVAEDTGRIVAFSMAYAEDGKVFALFTLPGFEGRGCGSLLLDEALAWLKSLGHERAWLSTGRGTRAQAFYERRGWTIAGSDPDDRQDIVLTKQL